MWKIKKYPNRVYRGNYVYDEVRGREFVLYCVLKDHYVVFESFQAAKKLGWVKSSILK
jgi:hypothetical protein